MSLHIVTHPDYDAGFSASHRFPMGKYSALAQALDKRNLLTDGHVHRPALPPIGWLSLAHDRSYVDQVVACAVPASIEREIGFPINERTSRRAQLASSGTLLAARLALEHGIACNTAGGSHHARRSHGAGFCTFNDVPVAALVLLSEGSVGNVLVIDLDVHQGDGTAEILAGDARVFTASMHAARNYPVRKVASSFDVALPDGLEDDGYLDALQALLAQLTAERRFDLAFYNAGVDVHADDRLGRLSLTDDGIRRRDRAVITHLRSLGVPVCGVIGGGYAFDVDVLGERHAVLFEEAAALL
jgi:acetoin utilization deacetylase AcuC-like enzyme